MLLKPKNCISSRAASLLAALCCSFFVYAQQIETAETKTADTMVMESPVVDVSTIAKKDLILERPEVMASVDKVLWRRHL